MPLVITNSEIRYAEKILFGKIKVFDKERIDFIKNFDTLDLQAVPGSGKTTALLAKLLILEKHLPFAHNSGILVISHTNTAVNEIKEKIGKYCPKLFSYPNFVGTIQSFVDQFLAIPYYENQFKKKVYRIDNEIYEERISAYRLPLGARNWVNRKHDPVGFLKNIRFDTNFNLIPKLGKTEGDFELKDKNSQTYRALKKMKVDLLKWGYLHFDDAYFLSDIYLAKIPQIKKVIQNRFKFVFVDEMQDMDSHQYNLLDRLFYTKSVLNHAFQRIGDKNQAIFSGSAKIEDVWTDREKVMKMSGSQRLSPQIANVVKCFGLDFIEISGENENRNIPPVVILFTNDTIDHVISRFTEIIIEYKNNGAFRDKKNPIMAIGWNSTHDDPNRLGITDYHGEYRKINVGQKLDYQSLSSYLINFDKNKGTLEPIRKNILNSFLKILRFERIQFEDRPYTKRKLLDYLKDNFNSIYEELNLNIYGWAMSLINANAENVRNECSAFFRRVLADVFGRDQLSEVTILFLDNEEEEQVQEEENNQDRPNIFIANGVEVEIGSVHSVKGETHSATLYLETCYHQHETDKSRRQLIGERIRGNDGVRTKESAKMMYVGLSRPTTLSCYATNAIRVDDNMRVQLQDNGWRLVDLV